MSDMTILTKTDMYAEKICLKILKICSATEKKLNRYVT